MRKNRREKRLSFSSSHPGIRHEVEMSVSIFDTTSDVTKLSYRVPTRRSTKNESGTKIGTVSSLPADRQIGDLVHEWLRLRESRLSHLLRTLFELILRWTMGGFWHRTAVIHLFQPMYLATRSWLLFRSARAGSAARLRWLVHHEDGKAVRSKGRELGSGEEPVERGEYYNHICSRS